MEYSREDYLKHYIVQALFKLMGQYEYSKITITDVVNKAGVGRATFYRHFKTKEDVVTYHFDNVTRGYIGEQRYYPRCKQDYVDVTTRVFELCKQQKEALQLLHKAHLDHIYFEYLNKNFSQMFERSFPQSDKYEPLIYSGMLFNVTIAWIEDDCKTLPEQLAQMIIDKIYFEK